MSRESHPEIAGLLRSCKPDPRPSPGLESRIMQSLQNPRSQRPGPVWPWFLLPPAVAAGIALMWPQPAAPSSLSRHVPAPPAPVPAAGITDRNPLELETLALRTDVRRASHFLIDCLPGSSAGLD